MHVDVSSFLPELLKTFSVDQKKKAKKEGGEKKKKAKPKKIQILPDDIAQKIALSVASSVRRLRLLLTPYR